MDGLMLPDYPMTSALSAEHRPIGSRAKLVTLAFSFTTLGSLGAALVYLVLLTAFKSSIIGKLDRLEWVWRLFFGIGMVPACVTAYMRFKMKQSATFTKCQHQLEICKFMYKLMTMGPQTSRQCVTQTSQSCSNRRKIFESISRIEDISGRWWQLRVVGSFSKKRPRFLAARRRARLTIAHQRHRQLWYRTQPKHPSRQDRVLRRPLTMGRLWRIAIGNLIVLFAVRVAEPRRAHSMLACAPRLTKSLFCIRGRSQAYTSAACSDCCA